MAKKNNSNGAKRGKSFAAMTDAERNAAVAQFDGGMSFDDTRPLSPKGQALWAMAKRGPGRPRKPEGEKARDVVITVEPRLLARADAFAKQHGKSRSELFADGVTLVMSGGGSEVGTPPAKSARRSDAPQRSRAAGPARR